MPYIKSDRRSELYETYLHRKEEKFGDWKKRPQYCENAGELNFVLTKIVQEYFQKNGGHYQQINDIIGALEGCKLEFYRRLVSKFEDKKAIENGDVF